MKRSTFILNSIAETKSALERAKQREKDSLEFIENYSTELAAIEEAMTPVEPWLISFQIDASSKAIDLKYAGDKHTLNGCFSALRKAGYTPTSRPDKDATYFTCFWDLIDNNRFSLKFASKPKKPMRIYFVFSSTVCKRVKVGVQMVEKDIYETVCE